MLYYNLHLLDDETGSVAEQSGSLNSVVKVFFKVIPENENDENNLSCICVALDSTCLHDSYCGH